jgi:carotenoid cleavage dioxygenase-like enzyme
MARGADNPFRPMRFEATVEDCIVVDGEIPPGISGGYHRNGPAWRRPTTSGRDAFFTIDGMIQSLVISEGRATYRNRWIRTPKFEAEERAGRALFRWSDEQFDDYRFWGLGEVERDEFTTGVPQGTNFVNVVPFDGDLVAVGEHCVPVALDPATLETRGVVPWSPKLSPGMFEPTSYGDSTLGAHPKWDHATGTLYGWSYRDREPYVTLHWIRPGGAVQSREIWDAPYNTFAHDMWLTESYVVIPFQPFYMSLDHVRKGMGVFGWDPDLGTVLGLIPRDDINGEIRWIRADFETQFILHTMSANEVDGQLVLDGPIFERPPFQTEPDYPAGTPYIPFWAMPIGVMGRWIVDLASGTVKGERTGDYAVELPKIDERFYGKNYQYGLALAGVERGMKFDSLLRRNVRTGAEELYRVIRDSPGSLAEPCFIPRHEGAAEGDGYVLLPNSNFARNMGEFLLFDTDGISDGAIARIEIPFAMGWTPHGHWLPLPVGAAR